MICPHCQHDHTSVVDTRPDNGSIRRRRVCDRCGKRFSTWEYTEAQLAAHVRRRRDQLMESARLDLARLVTDAREIVRKLGT